MAELMRLIVLLFALFVAGCATSPPPAPTSGSGSTSANPAAAEQPSGNPAGAPARPSTEAATLALLAQSSRAADSGDLESALAYAERAVRIEPRRADLWIRLAELALAGNHPATAIQYANKALSLAAERPDLQRDAWMLVADAKEAQGDLAEAAEIRRRWRTARG